jgi:hypothetical protein
MKSVLLILSIVCCALALSPDSATHIINITVDTGSHTSSNFLHQVDLSDQITEIDKRITSTDDIIVCPGGDTTTRYPKWVYYDSAVTCEVYFDGPISSSATTSFDVWFGTGLNGVNAVATYTNNSIDNFLGIRNFSGNTFYDHVGNNDGTGSGVDTSTCTFGVGALYDNSNDEINMGTLPNFNTTNKKTVSFILDNSQSTGAVFLFRIFNDATNRFVIYISAAGLLALQLSNSTTAYAQLDITSLLVSGTPGLVTLVYDGTGATNADKVKWYINGELETSSFTGTFTTTTGDLSTTAATLGDNISADIIGKLDEVSVINESKDQYYIADRYSALFDSTFYTVSTIRSANTSYKRPKFRSDLKLKIGY